MKVGVKQGGMQLVMLKELQVLPEQLHLKHYATLIKLSH